MQDSWSLSAPERSTAKGKTTLDLARALSFIEENGTGLEKARLGWVLYGTRPEPETVRPFLQLQNADGGFPFGLLAGNPSTLNNTLTALCWLDELGMLRSPAAGRAFDYLLATQRDDGGWDEDPSVAEYGPPPWATPGDLRARLYLSADAAFWLAAGGHRSEPAFRRALDFLLNHQEEGGGFHGYLHTTWIATGAFALAGDRYRTVVERGLQALSERPLSDWVDSQICWALESLGMAGLGKEEPFVEACLAELVRKQVADGRWVSEDGEARSVAATLGVLKVLKRYGLLE